MTDEEYRQYREVAAKIDWALVGNHLSIVVLSLADALGAYMGQILKVTAPDKRRGTLETICNVIRDRAV